MTPPFATAPVRFELLDVSRFAAAFAVLIYHWLFKGIQMGTVDSISYSPLAGIAAYGYLGVYFFFMISGFVISASSHGRTASQFAVRRAVRLYPAFWVSMLTTALVTIAIGGTLFSVTVPQVLANLTMLPQLLRQPTVDGVYWTLFCEILFYGMVFLILLAKLGRYLDAFFPGWAIFLLAITVIAPQLSRYELIGSLYAFFAAGAIISTIQRRGWSWWRAVGLLASAYVSLRYIIEQTTILNDGNNGPFVQSMPVTIAIVIGFFVIMMMQTSARVATWRIPHSRLLGALTYPVYLLHAHIGYMVIDRFADDENKWWIYAILLALVLGSSYVICKLVEERPRRMWLAFFDGTVGRLLRGLEQLPRRVFGKRTTV